MEKTESRNKTDLNRRTLRWLWDAVKGKKRYIIVLVILQVVLGAAAIGYSLIFRQLIDWATERYVPGFWLSLGALIGITVLRLSLNFVIRWVNEYASSGVENALKHRLFDTLLQRDYASVTGVHTGEWMNRLTSDTVVVAAGITQIIPNVGGMLVRLVGAVAVILVLQPLFGTILIPAALLFLVVTRVFRPLLKRLHKNIQQSDGRLRVLLQERLDNLLIISTFSQRERSVELADDRMAEHKAARMKRNHVSNFSQTGFAFAVHALYLTGAAFCAYGIMNGTVSYGTMTAVMQLIGYLQAPFSGLSGYFSQWYAMLASAERLMEAEAFPRDQGEDVVSQQVVRQYYAEEFTGIRTEELRFSYVEKRGRESVPLTIRYENMEVKKGEYVALVGPSGCGKSTLLKLLMCLYKPDSGKMLLQSKDTAERELSPKDRGLFAYVPQGNQLMSGTIREVISFYDKEKMAREDELWWALKIACAEEFVSQLPQGLDTLLGEHGSGLSEGQIQRLAVARAVFSGRPILLLDEATSALDENTESSLLNNLRAMTDHTVLIVTHRPRACEVCDRIVKLKPGTEESVTEE